MRSRDDGEMPKRSFRLLKEELRKQIPRITLLVLLAILGTGVGLIQPLLFKALIDSAIPTADLQLIGLLLAGMVIVPVLSAGLHSANHYLRAYIGESVAQRLRRESFDHLLHVRLAALEQFKTGEHVHRLTSSSGKIGEVYVGNHLLPLMMNAILLVGTLTAMMALSWRLSLLALLAFPLSYLLTRKTRGHARRCIASSPMHWRPVRAICTRFSPDCARSGRSMPNLTRKGVGRNGLRGTGASKPG